MAGNDQREKEKQKKQVEKRVGRYAMEKNGARIAELESKIQSIE